MVHQEIADQSVRGLAADGHGRVLAIVGRHSLCRRSTNGEWTEIAKSEFELSCCVAIGNVVFVGTDDAHILRVDLDGTQQRLTGFDVVEGRDKWYRGTAIIDGKLMGRLNSFNGGDMRWCRASGQRPYWRNSAIDRRRPNVAAHYRYR